MKSYNSFRPLLGVFISNPCFERICKHYLRFRPLLGVFISNLNPNYPIVAICLVFVPYWGSLFLIR